MHYAKGASVSSLHIRESTDALIFIVGYTWVSGIQGKRERERERQSSP